MTVQITSSENIALFMQLSSRRDDYFVRARVIDQTDNPITGSPFVLTNQGDGLYTNFSVGMPATATYLVCQYEIYSDAGFSEVVTNEAPDVDFFKRDVNVVSKLDQIIAKLSGLALPGAAIQVTVDQEEITGLINDVQEVKTMLAKDEATVSLIDDNATKAVVDDEEINVNLDCE